MFDHIILLFSHINTLSYFVYDLDIAYMSHYMVSIYSMYVVST